MNFIVYRHGKIGFPEAHWVGEGVHLKVLSSDPDAYFTDQGFIYPLSATGPDIADVVSGRIPLANKRQAQLTMTALMITHKGAVCQVDLFKGDNGPSGRGGWALDFHTLPKGPKAAFVMCSAQNERDCLLGALAAWKSEKKFQKDTDSMSIGQNYPITWITVEDVIKRLHELHPPKEEHNDPEEFFGSRRRNHKRPGQDRPFLTPHRPRQ